MTRSPSSNSTHLGQSIVETTKPRKRIFAIRDTEFQAMPSGSGYALRVRLCPQGQAMPSGSGYIHRIWPSGHMDRHVAACPSMRAVRADNTINAQAGPDEYIISMAFATAVVAAGTSVTITDTVNANIFTFEEGIQISGVNLADGQPNYIDPGALFHNLRPYLPSQTDILITVEDIDASTLVYWPGNQKNDYTAKFTYTVNDGIHDSVIPGTGDDVVDPGLGDDDVDLGAGEGTDAVIYRFGMDFNGNIIAWSGGNTITGFTPGEDQLLIGAVGTGGTGGDPSDGGLGGNPDDGGTDDDGGDRTSFLDGVGEGDDSPRSVAVGNDGDNVIDLANDVSAADQAGAWVIFGGGGDDTITLGSGTPPAGGTEEVVYRLGIDEDNNNAITAPQGSDEATDGSDTVDGFALGTDRLTFVDTIGTPPTATAEASAVDALMTSLASVSLVYNETNYTGITFEILADSNPA